MLGLKLFDDGGVLCSYMRTLMMKIISREGRKVLESHEPCT